MALYEVPQGHSSLQPYVASAILDGPAQGTPVWGEVDGLLAGLQGGELAQLLWEKLPCHLNGFGNFNGMTRVWLCCVSPGCILLSLQPCNRHLDMAGGRSCSGKSDSTI